MKLSVTAAVTTNEFDAAEAVEVPFVLVAVTVYVYVPDVVSVKEIGLDVPELEAPEDERTV